MTTPTTDEPTPRTFPFISGDRIRLPHWDADRFVRVGGYGLVYFIGETNKGVEGPYLKDGEKAYGAAWELYAPAPAPQEIWATYLEDEEILRLWFDKPAPPHDRSGTTTWKVTITPTERIYP